MLLEKVRDFISDGQLLEPAARVVVGVSGGADSTALLVILHGLGYNCTAVHCNFHLRGGESERDMLFVRDLCARLGIGLEICSYDTAAYSKEHGISIEMAARELRYRDFERIRVENGATAICVAHHREDSVETVLINLLRGTGIRGLGGIRPKNGYVVRPLLCASRQEIEDYLAGIGQDFVTDSTNLETDYTRNRIRLQLMPVMRLIAPNADAAIFQTASHVRQALEFYKEAMDKAIGEVCTNRTANDSFDIDIKALQSLDNNGCGMLRSKAVLFEILSPLGFSESQTDIVAANLDQDSGRRYMAGNHVIVKDRQCLLVRPAGCLFEPLGIEVKDGLEIPTGDGRRLRFSFAPAGSPISKDPHTATFDAATVGRNLVLRRVEQGDSFHPFGMKGRRLLSDFMTDLKMSLPQKQSQLVLACGEDILWVVGLRSDNRYRVTSKTGMQLVVKVLS